MFNITKIRSSLSEEEILEWANLYKDISKSIGSEEFMFAASALFEEVFEDKKNDWQA